MNRSQYQECMKPIAAHFPETHGWMVSQSEDTKVAWADLFADIEPRDLNSAVSEFLRDGEITTRYDREGLPRTLKRLAVASRSRREERATMEASRKRFTAHRGGTMADGFKQLLGGGGWELVCKINDRCDAFARDEGRPVTKAEHHQISQQILREAGVLDAEPDDCTPGR